MDTLHLTQLCSFGAIVGASVFFMIAERRWPYNRGQKLLRTGFWLDVLWYTVIQSYVLALVISELLTRIRLFLGLPEEGPVGHWPIWLQVVLFMLVHDLYIYAFHRWQHRNPYLWRTHEAHHSVPEVDWLSGIRSHPFEILINQTIEYAPLILLGVHPIAILIKSSIGSIYGMFIHSNLNARLGPFRRVFNGPELHRWHHANCDTRAYDKNFATKFTIWDQMFGTWYEPEGEAKDYGLPDAPFPEGNGRYLWADGYLRQTALLFRRERRS